MLKKSITYKDYNGESRTEDFYFNLNETEAARMDIITPGGMRDHMQRTVASKDGEQIMKMFEDFISKSYGEKSPDGKYFYKSEEISKKFMCTEAYNVLVMELMKSPLVAGEFISAVLPFNSEQRKQFNEAVAETAAEIEKKNAEKSSEPAKIQPFVANNVEV